MTEGQIRFEDGAAYERTMGIWSRLVGDVFLDWLGQRSGMRWLDIGCGNGAFTELVVDLCAPAKVQGIDPSEGQLAFARTRPAGRIAEFRQGNAMALPYSEASFDAAVMALVIPFVADPAKAVAEMVRVTRPGGVVAAYIWDLLGGGYPFEPIEAELRAIDVVPLRAPGSEHLGIEALDKLWRGARLDAVETREIMVQRTFANFDEFWENSLTVPNIAPVVAAMAPSDIDSLKTRLRSRLPADAQGRISNEARAKAIKGYVK